MEKWKHNLQPIRSVLINGLCNFEDGTRAADRELVELSYAEHFFKVYL